MPKKEKEHRSEKTKTRALNVSTNPPNTLAKTVLRHSCSGDWFIKRAVCTSAASNILTRAGSSLNATARPHHHHHHHHHPIARLGPREEPPYSFRDGESGRRLIYARTERSQNKTQHNTTQHSTTRYQSTLLTTT